MVVESGSAKVRMASLLRSGLAVLNYQSRRVVYKQFSHSEAQLAALQDLAIIPSHEIVVVSRFPYLYAYRLIDSPQADPDAPAESIECLHETEMTQFLRP